MKTRSILTLALALVISPGMAIAADGKLDGAYKFVSVTFDGGSQTEADAKGMIVVHGRHWSNIRAGVDRKTWSREEPEAERTKKIVEAYQSLTADCGTFEIEGNTVTMRRLTGGNPGAPASSKWEYKLEGNKLTLKPKSPAGQPPATTVFTYERLP